jgi:3-deoxy-D-manno-octulosonic-acid transferase
MSEQAAVVRAAMALYDGVWAAAIPWLRRNRRLADGFEARTLAEPPGDPVDVWVQAASAGEAYLAADLISALSPAPPRGLLATTNTRQGFDILTRVREAAFPTPVRPRFFPFDRPRIMERAVASWSPRLMVVLETEIWPGLFFQLKRSGVPILLANGRITPASLRAYRRWPGLWRRLSPDRILAISGPDADRFRRLFPGARVGVMPNMKFDRIAPVEDAAAKALDAFRGLLDPGRPFVVLGSVRREEEEAVEAAVARLLRRRPEIRVGLFPRHLHRLAEWRRRLDRIGVGWRLRSEGAAPSGGGVLLWDTFGELSLAYAAASCAFVGGSLAPLGGQNFLEPLSAGTLPVIGPSWENFAWVGTRLFEEGLVRSVPDGPSLADALERIVDRAPDRDAVRGRFMDAVRPYRGGCRIAADAVREILPGGAVPDAPGQ